jgi:hypothetical protein
VPRNSDKYAVVQVQLSYDTSRALGKRAVYEDSSMASIIRRAVALYLYNEGDAERIRAAAVKARAESTSSK